AHQRPRCNIASSRRLPPAWLRWCVETVCATGSNTRCSGVMSNATIELGEDWSVREYRSAGPAHQRTRRWHGVAAVLVALLLSGSAATSVPPITPLFTVPGSVDAGLLIAKNKLFVAARVDAPAARLTA